MEQATHLKLRQAAHAPLGKLLAKLSTNRRADSVIATTHTYTKAIQLL